MSCKLAEIPYHKDSSGLFAFIEGEPWSIFLDSGYPYIDTGRFDIFSSSPYMTFETNGLETVIDEKGITSRSAEDPFLLVKKALGKPVRNLTGLPFCGGALGYFAYDLGRRIEQLPEQSSHDLKVPDMAIGLYDWAVVVDHHLRRSWLVGQGRDSETMKRWDELHDTFQKIKPINENSFKATSKYHSNFNTESYGKAFNKIKKYIKEGDCYQVNLAQRFEVDVEGRAWDAYLKLRELNPAPFASYMNLPACAVLSSSPERFLKLNNGIVETKPIKGTRRRSVFAYEDTALAQELLESEKDRAENLMIVDLLRNDLGKSCVTGSIAVPKLYDLESYATVHHLVSTITGRLKESSHALQLLRDCFPGGSITGAPKLRSMEIIEELEPHRRNIYCGSMGYIGFDGNMDSNIAIRTLVHHKQHLYCWAGGGIVHDSKMESEYQECFDKASALLKLFEYHDD